MYSKEQFISDYRVSNIESIFEFFCKDKGLRHDIPFQIIAHLFEDVQRVVLEHWLHKYSIILLFDKENKLIKIY